jgi:DNA-binding NtrC family response regulator
MKQAAPLARGKVTPKDLPSEVLEDRKAAHAPPTAVEEAQAPIPEGIVNLWNLENQVGQWVEERLIREALAQTQGDRQAAAELLKIHPKTLARKARELDLH